MKIPISPKFSEKTQKIIQGVLEQIEREFPDDYRSLCYLVEAIEPLPQDLIDINTRGEWVATRQFSCAEDYRLSGFHGEAQGRIRIADDTFQDKGTVAHELGHAFTSLEDLDEREGPSDEWRSEACADLHAVRWKQLTYEDIRKRHENNAKDGDWFHHGPPPGGSWIELDNVKWVLDETFVFRSLPTGG